MRSLGFGSRTLSPGQVFVLGLEDEVPHVSRGRLELQDPCSRAGLGEGADGARGELGLHRGLRLTGMSDHSAPWEPAVWALNCGKTRKPRLWPQQEAHSWGGTKAQRG